MPKFQGFEPEDFEDNVAGTRSRGTSRLGGVLTARLHERLRRGDQIRTFYRTPEIYLVPAFSGRTF